MAQDIELKIIIDAENKVSSVIKDVESKVGGLQQKVKDLQPVFKGMAATGGIALAGIVAFGKGAVDAANEAALVQAQLGAALESTHGAAGLFIEDLNDQAKALQRMTTYTDEAVNSAQAMLLTFTNVKGPIFQSATQAILDMSTALGQDLKSSSIQVGKALNDPILGVSALRKVGVSFTQDQQDVIKKLVETGQTAKAQQLIIKELNTEFGGSAAAAAGTFAGKMEQLKNAMGDVQENIGNALLPYLQKLVDKIVPIVNKILDWTAAHPKLTAAILGVSAGLAALVTVIGVVGIAMGALTPVAVALGISLGALLGWIVIIPIAIAALIAAGVWLYKHWDDVKQKAGEVWNAVAEFFKNNVDKILLFIGPAGWLVLAGKYLVQHWGEIKQAAADIWNSIAAFFGSVWEAIKTIFKVAVDFVVGLVVLGFKAMGIDIVAVMGTMRDAIVAAWAAIKSAWTSAVNAISAVTTAVWGAVSGFIGARMGEIKAVISAVWDFIKNIWKAGTDVVKNTTQGWGDAIKKIFNDVVGFVSDKVKWITDKLDAIKNAAGNVTSKVGGAISGAFNSVVNAGKNITGFAEGGVVPGPKGAPMMAMVHGGERVLTADEAEGFGGGMVLNFNFAEVVAGDDGIRRIIQQTISTLNRSATMRGVAGR